MCCTLTAVPLRTALLIDRNRGAILTLHDGELEPSVLQYLCVPHPEPLIMRSHADVHHDALKKVCPYMPLNFRMFVELAAMLGPAQPLAGLRGTDVIGAANGSVNVSSNGNTVGSTVVSDSSGSRSNSGAGAAVGAAAGSSSSGAVSKGSSRNLRSSALASSMEADAKAAAAGAAIAAVQDMGKPVAVIDVPPPPPAALQQAEDERPQQLARMSPHDKFAYESRNDRLNEQHPDVTASMFKVLLATADLALIVVCSVYCPVCSVAGDDRGQSVDHSHLRLMLSVTLLIARSGLHVYTDA
jgi:hypothetical protein